MYVLDHGVTVGNLSEKTSLLHEKYTKEARKAENGQWSTHDNKVCLVFFSRKTLLSIKCYFLIAAVNTAEITLEMQLGKCPAHGWHSVTNA